MRLRTLLSLMTALAVALPASVLASPFVITIDGVDTSASAIAAVQAAIALSPGTARPVLAGMYLPLGNCNTTPGLPNSCDGSASVGTNPLASVADVEASNLLNGTNFSSAAIYGYGLPLDQMILHRFESSFDVSGGVFTPPATGAFAQAFDFIVGSTGGGSAGSGTFDYNLDLVRSVRIMGVDDLGNLIDLVQLVHQAARLTVGWDADTMLVFASDAVTFDLGASGNVQVRLMAEGPITAGDPDIGVGITAVPEPSTFALLWLAIGVARIARRRVQAAG